MSICIKKQGLLDSIQDGGRYGYQYLGIHPGGTMDLAAMRIANALVGNAANEPVIEMHFPAATILFETTALIAISGADFGAAVDGIAIKTNRPILINQGAELTFKKQLSGARTYLSVAGGWVAESWLNSYSTNIEVNAGGHAGKALRKNDKVEIKTKNEYRAINNEPVFMFPWWADAASINKAGPIRMIPGDEYEWLKPEAKQKLVTDAFLIQPQSNRMGYRLQAEPLLTMISKELISTAVTRGTLQLLPDGQLIVLMADHQTTGGYPRIGHAISADMGRLAQVRQGETIFFELIDLASAEQYACEYEQNLRQLEFACNFRLQEQLYQVLQ